MSMSDDNSPKPYTPPSQTAGVTDVVTQLTNIVRQLSIWSQSIINATPAATKTVSPQFTAATLSTTASVIVSSSITRHGLLIHNPSTINVYVYQTGMTSPPVLGTLAGSIVIFPGDTLALPSSMFTNINAGFSGFSASATPGVTAVEFF